MRYIGGVGMYIKLGTVHDPLSSQACVRVCLKHLSNIKESGYFLVRDCDKLSSAFGLRDMFLKETHGIAGDETGVIW